MFLTRKKIRRGMKKSPSLIIETGIFLSRDKKQGPRWASEILARRTTVGASGDDEDNGLSGDGGE